MAIRTGSHKIIWRQKMFRGEKWKPVDSAHCGGNGQCCSGISTRLCLCQLADIYCPPMVIDLTTNWDEDPTKALDPNSPETKQIVENAESMRLAKARSIADDNDYTWEDSDTADDLLVKVAQLPNLM